MNKRFSGKALLSWLIPILSLLVIYETLILTRHYPKKDLDQRLAYIPVPKVEESAGATVRLSFVPAGVSLHQGETVSVDLWLSPKKKLRLDGINLTIDFNPEFVQITQVMVPKLFSSVVEDKEVEKEGKLHLIFLEEEKGGLWSEKEVKLLSLLIKGKAMGEGEITLATKEGTKTVITETGTSKKVPFDYGNLKLVVY